MPFWTVEAKQAAFISYEFNSIWLRYVIGLASSQKEHLLDKACNTDLFDITNLLVRQLVTANENRNIAVVVRTLGNTSSTVRKNRSTHEYRKLMHLYEVEQKLLHLVRLLSLLSQARL